MLGPSWRLPAVAGGGAAMEFRQGSKPARPSRKLRRSRSRRVRLLMRLRRQSWGDTSGLRSRLGTGRKPVLPLRSAGAAHDGPYVDDLLATRDVVAVVRVGAHVERGAINFEALAEFEIVPGFGPSQAAVL